MLKKLELTNDEALVLFELLHRTSDMEEKIIFKDKSERHILWNLECQLEKILLEPSLPNYKQLVEQSRNSIRMENE